MTIDELKAQLISFTTEYQKALEEQTQSVLEYEKCEENLKKLENHFLLANEIEEKNSDEVEDENAELIDLEAKLEKLKLELLHTESEVELEARQNNTRATESNIKALVGINENVHRLRNRIIDGKAYIKTKKAELQRERKENWEKEKQKRMQAKLKPENTEITEMKERVNSMRQRNLIADDKVEVLRKKLEILKLLTPLITEK